MNLQHCVKDLILGLRVPPGFDRFKWAADRLGIQNVSTVYKWTETSDESGVLIPLKHLLYLQEHSDSLAVVQYFAELHGSCKIDPTNFTDLDGKADDEIVELVCESAATLKEHHSQGEIEDNLIRIRNTANRGLAELAKSRSRH